MALYVLSSSSPLTVAGLWFCSHATPTSCTDTNPSDDAVKKRPKENTSVPGQLHHHSSVWQGESHRAESRDSTPLLHEVFVCFGKRINKIKLESNYISTLCSREKCVEGE